MHLFPATRRAFLAGFLPLLLAGISTGIVSGQTLEWARRGGGAANSFVLSTAVDGSGNVFASGLFSGASAFGPNQANQTILTSAGGPEDAFLAKYDAAGFLQWARRAGGVGFVGAYGVAADAAGNSYITGEFFGSATFGPTQPNQTVLASAGDADVFVAKYDPAGMLLWARRAGGAGSADRSQGIAVDPSGNVYITGSFDVSATFGPGQPSQITLTASGAVADIFVAKYNSAGTLLWAKRAGGVNDEEGRAIAVDATGNSYVTGYFQGNVIFGPGEAGATNLVSVGQADMFVAKFTSAGTLAWARRDGGVVGDVGLGIAVDFVGNTYVTGYFGANATFGQGQGNATVLNSVGIEDIVVAKFDSAGAMAWARRAGGTASDVGAGIAVDSQGNAYLTGLFQGSATFGPGQPNQTLLTSAGSDDPFVAKYNTAGVLAWARRDGGTAMDLGYGIAFDDVAKAAYAGGGFAGTATFGAGQINQTVLSSAGAFDFYLAKYRDGLAASPAVTGIGIYRNGAWFLDSNRNGSPDDALFSFSLAGSTRITGDWNGDGREEIGLYYDGFWFLDFNGNGAWDGGAIDRQYQFGYPGVQPVIGDWSGSGRDKIGIFVDGYWFLDLDGDGAWGGPGVDVQTQFGFAGVKPIVGDWSGSGSDKIGIYVNGFWFLDLNGNAVWEGPGTDFQTEFGWSAVTPLIGDWNGDGKTTIGFYINGFWYLDKDGDGIWDGPGSDIVANFGFNGVTPIVGDWNGSGSDKIGIFINGFWYLDFDGSANWDGGVADKAYAYGQAGDTPTTGKW